jgi:uncharacterized protein YaaW (UPF0174 family)
MLPLFGCSRIGDVSDPLLPYLAIEKKWGKNELTEFLNHLNRERQKLILIALEKKPDDFMFDVEKVKREIRWQASHWITYPFREKSDYDYHREIVRWVAEEFDVNEHLVNNAPTFVLERKIMESLFAKIWEKLNEKQRRELLDKMDKENSLSVADKVKIATLASGAAALTALSVTAYFAGFAFYTTMASVIATCAGFLGVTLPFATYATTSAMLATLSGPVGWACIGVAAIGSSLFLGRANPSRTAAVICQIHLLKVEVLQKSGKEIAV